MQLLVDELCELGLSLQRSVPLSPVIDMRVADQGLPRGVGNELDDLRSVGGYGEVQQMLVVTSWFPSWGLHPAQEMDMSWGSAWEDVSAQKTEPKRTLENSSVEGGLSRGAVLGEF